MVQKTRLTDDPEAVAAQEARPDRRNRFQWLFAPKVKTIGLVAPASASVTERTTWTPCWSQLALRVADLESAARELEAKGVVLAPAAPAIGGGWLRNFTDPEGNKLQIVQR